MLADIGTPGQDINGVDLRQTKVWPEITAPFCILLATNRRPDPSAGFRLISPRLETSLNDAGTMRIDALNAEVIASKQLAETPEILKILFRGTKADFGIVERLRSHGHPTLEAFWRDAIGVSSGGQLKGSGNGYQKLRPSSRTRRQGDGRPGEDARALHGLSEITAATFTGIAIDHSRLSPFTQERVHHLRSRAIYSGPLIVVHEAPPVLVEGEYAWGNREAFMIAYVRDGSSIGTKLTPFLSNASSQTPPGYLVEALPVAKDSGGCDLAHSRHGRSFAYLAGPDEVLEPGSISIWHLWLS